MGDLDSLLDRKTRRVRELEAEVERLREALQLLVDAVEDGDGLAVVTALEHARALGETEAE